MTLETLLFMIFVYAVCIGGFVYSLYRASKSK